MRQLLEAHGAKAIAEAAQNAIDLEAKGEVELARTWRHIEDAMKLMRGPHHSSMGIMDADTLSGVGRKTAGQSPTSPASSAT